MTRDEAARLALTRARGLALLPPHEALRKVHIALVACRGEPYRDGVLEMAAWAILALALAEGDAPEEPALDLGAMRRRAEREPGSIRSEHGCPVPALGYAEQLVNSLLGPHGPVWYRRERKGVTYADHERKLVDVMRDVLRPAYEAQADRRALLAEVERLSAELASLRESL